MNIRKFYGYLPRFRTKEDADTYMQCVKERTQVPPDIWIWPFIVVKGMAVINPEYKNAPFEASVI